MTSFSGGDAGPRWTVLLAYYNEEEFLAETLRSLTDQTLRPFDIVAVDNASRDRSAAIAREELDGRAGINAVHLHQPKPGQINALQMGLEAVRTEFVMICDADTFYPPHYLEEADRAFAAGGEGLVGVMASDIYSPAHGWSARM